MGVPLVNRQKCGFSKRSVCDCISQLADTFLPTVTDPQFLSEELKDATLELHILDKLRKGRIQKGWTQSKVPSKSIRVTLVLISSWF